MVCVKPKEKDGELGLKRRNDYTFANYETSRQAPSFSENRADNLIVSINQKGLKTGMKSYIVAFIASLLLMFGIINAINNSTPDKLSISSPYVPDHYTLSFFDEFDMEGLNAEKWRNRYSEGRTYGAGIASHQSVSQIGDGYLRLITRHESDQFLTGMVRSVPQFKYGYFEARILFQKLQGHHGAFWLQSETYGQVTGNPAQSGAEIDIIEFFGAERQLTDAKQNVYYDPYISGQKQPGAEFDVFYRSNHDEIELNDAFHIFGLLWTEAEYVFYIDGVETWRTNTGLSQVEEYIVLSLTTSEWENARLDVNKLPDEMVIDYVRVYYP